MMGGWISKGAIASSSSSIPFASKQLGPYICRFDFYFFLARKKQYCVCIDFVGKEIEIRNRGRNG